MKWLSLIFLLITTFSINAQDCSYRVNSVSGMDGTRLVITEPVELTSNFNKEPLQAWTTIYGDTALVLALVILSPDDIPLKKGDKVSLLTSENDSIVLKIFQDPVLATSTPKKLTCLIVLSPENIVSIEENTVTKVLIEGEDYQQEGGVKKRESEALTNLIVCVKEYLN